MLVIALAAACIAAGTATGDPSISDKRAQAQHVAAEIQQLDAGLERARNRYEMATEKLRQIEHNLRNNKVALHAARANLKASQRSLMQRLVAIYTSRDDQSTLGVILGATSITDLVNRVETVQSVSNQDVAVMNEVIGFKKAVVVHQRALVREHKSQRVLVGARAAAKQRIGSQLGHEQRLYTSIKGEIAHMVAVEAARQLALKRAAEARYQTTQVQQALTLQDTPVGVTASAGGETVAPPSQYGGVVGIAMRYRPASTAQGSSRTSIHRSASRSPTTPARSGMSVSRSPGATSSPATSSSSTGWVTSGSTSAAISSSTPRTPATS